MKRTVFVISCILACFTVSMAAQEAKKDDTPEIHGTIRAKYEYEPTIGKGRFEIRNARMSVEGKIIPVVQYKAEIDLSEQLPSLKEKVPTKFTMKQKEALKKEKKEPLKKEKKEPETDLNGNVIVPRYDCVTSHTARRTGITNMYLSHRYTILQIMHVSGHKTQKTFMDYIKLSSEEIADEIAAMSKKENDMW